MEAPFWRRGTDELLHRIEYRFECSGVVHGQIGEYLAVQIDVVGMNLTHELRIAHAMHAGRGVDTLDPKCTEAALFVFAVAVGVLQTFFDSVFSNCPYVFAGTEITLGQF